MAERLVVHWRKGRLVAMQGHVARGAVQVRRAVALPWPADFDERTPASLWGQWLRDAFQKAGIEGTSAALIVPRDEVVFRRLELPNAPDEELPDFVRLQAATVSSAPLERLMLDFLPLPTLPDAPGRTVLLATIFRDRVDQARKIFSAAGIDLSSVTTSSIALGELAMHLQQRNGGGLDDTLAALAPNDHDVDLVVLHRRKIVLTQSLDLEPEDFLASPQRALAEIGRALVPLESLIGTGRLSQCFAAGLGEAFAAQWAGRLDCPVAAVDPFSEGGLANSGEGIRAEDRASYAACIGHLLTGQAPLAESLDFLNPRRPIARKDYTKHRYAAAAAAVVLLIGGVYAKLKFDEARLDDQIAALQKRDAEVSDFNKRNEATLGKANDLAAWTARQIDWLEQMRAIGGLLPGTSDLYLSDLRAVPSTGDASGRVRVTGYARERRLVESVAQRLAAAKYRVRPPEIRFSQRDAGFQYRFEIDVDLLLAATAQPKPVVK